MEEKLEVANAEIRRLQKEVKTLSMLYVTVFHLLNCY